MYPTVIMQDVEHLLDSVLASAMPPNSEFVTDVRHLLLRPTSKTGTPLCERW